MKQKNNYNESKNTFTKEMLNDTLKYQKKYNFNIGTDGSAWNNEADAFRHAYMQSILSQRYGKSITKGASLGHEIFGSLKGQDPREANMDIWNNHQGQQIYNEIQREYPSFGKLPEEKKKDIIAQKVIQRMNAGKLITGLGDPRKYGKHSITPMPWVGGVTPDGKPLGFATGIDYNQLQDFQLEDFNIDNQQVQSQSGLSGYTNPLTGNNRIFTREEIGAMSPKEYAKHEIEIDAQMHTIGVPTNGDMKRESMTGGGVVYVESYTRSDGTEVKGYYRSRPRG